ncbi:hypothetical protein PIROE2DRAFT_21187 [Piromyces sp. E2]|nr:hypothetical protein PIROE2DRAFT_21187 [Piromyces sp. E2]|eukprot:OUM59724.1 hypothetical protein PIROE2DRAFT_21187 [Piromyces sp. E2]
MKMCTKEQADEGTCKTKRCKTNDECISGLCYSNTCITEQPVYVCTGTEGYDRHLLKCKKRNYMKCDSDNECISSDCSDGYCKIHKVVDHSIRDNVTPMLINVLGFPFMLYALLKTMVAIIKKIDVSEDGESKKDSKDKESKKESKEKETEKETKEKETKKESKEKETKTE